MEMRRWILGVVLIVAPLLASADGPPAKLDSGDGFGAFCGQWMQKLAERERANLAGARAVESGDRTVLEYVGYAREPLSCTSRVEQPGRPGVGVIVYHELRYRRSGEDTAAARVSTPEVLEKIEVTEVFRYDGSRWSY